MLYTKEFLSSLSLSSQRQKDLNRLKESKHILNNPKAELERLKLAKLIFKEMVLKVFEKETYPSRTVLRKLDLGIVIYLIEKHEGSHIGYLEKHFKKQLLLLEKQNKLPSHTKFNIGQKTKREDIYVGEMNDTRKKTFFVSAVIPGFSIDKRFLDNIIAFKKERDASLILLPMKGTENQAFWSQSEWESIKNEVFTTFQFNSNLKAFDILLKPNQVNPLTGLERFGQKDFSLVIASPKQQMKSVAVSGSKSAHVMWTTGTVCKNKDYNEDRIGMLALQDHILGGLIVEVDDDEFFIRPVQALIDGSFIDKNQEFKNGEVKIAPKPKLYLGDSHAGWEDEQALQSTFSQIEVLNVDEIFIGDLFDGTSISHHHQKDIKAQVQRPDHLKTLELELHVVGKYLERFVSQFPNLKINIIKSNHDEHLDRYLTEGRYVDDRWNHRLALELAMYLLDDQNPIEQWINKNYPHLIKNLTWFNRNSSYKVKHIELACHGDEGADGKWGSALSLENSHGSGVFGHAHSPQILRGVYIVGTNSRKDLPYMSGASSWLHANCSIYPSGQRQMLISVNGKWTI